jgi:hypothetical protein
MPDAPARRTLTKRFAVALAAAMLPAVAPAASAQWKPERTVEIVVFSAPGGGNDKSARVIHKIWQESKLVDAVVTNKVGGGGSLAYTYVSQKTGDGHFLAIAQAGLVTNHITGRSAIHYGDLTPLAFVGNEPVGLAVRADSPYKGLKDFVAPLMKDPQALSVAVGSTRGATNHFAMALLAKAAGIDPARLKIVVFGGGAESVANLLGGHIDAMSQAINNAIPHHKARKDAHPCAEHGAPLARVARRPDLPRAGVRRGHGRLDHLSRRARVVARPDRLLGGRVREDGAASRMEKVPRVQFLGVGLPEFPGYDGIPEAGLRGRKRAAGRTGNGEAVTSRHRAPSPHDIKPS